MVVVSFDKEATPSSLEAEHKLKRKIKIIKYIFFNFICFSNQTKALMALCFLWRDKSLKKGSKSKTGQLEI